MNKEGQIVFKEWIKMERKKTYPCRDVIYYSAETYNEEELREQLDCLVLNPKTVKLKNKKRN